MDRPTIRKAIKVSHTPKKWMGASEVRHEFKRSCHGTRQMSLVFWLYINIWLYKDSQILDHSSVLFLTLIIAISTEAGRIHVMRLWIKCGSCGEKLPMAKEVGGGGEFELKPFVYSSFYGLYAVSWVLRYFIFCWIIYKTKIITTNSK